MSGLASVAARQGNAKWAARLFRVAETLREKTGAVPAFPATQILYEQDLANTRAQLDTKTLEAARTEGRMMALEEAVAEALEQRE